MSEQIQTPSPEKKQRFSRTQRLMLLGILVINVLIYGGFWYLGQSSGPRPTRSASEPQISAASEPMVLEDAYVQALALALDWQSDAQVIGAMASWQLTGGDQLSLERSAWAFQFYSPAKRQVQAVTVDLAGASVGRQQPVNIAPKPVLPDWSLDSEDLLLTFLGHGGQDFLTYHPSTNIHVQLKRDESDRSIWYITAIDPVARQSLVIGIDARSRQVIFSKDSTGGG